MKINKKVLGYIITVLTVIGLVGCSSGLDEESDYKTQKTEWVTDETGYLSKETLGKIDELNEEIFVDYELNPQYAVEVLVRLPEDNQDIDNYRNERFKELGVGDKEKDSGVLLVIDLDGRDVGIEVGYGLEDVIRDIEAGDIISGEMNDYLGSFMDTKEPEYLNKAVNQAMEEISVLIGKADSGVLFEERAEEEKITFWDIMTVFVIILFVILLAIIVAVAEGESGGSSGGYYSTSSSRSSGGFGGGMSGGGGASGGF